MYTNIIFLHSITRWLVLVTLLYALYRSINGLLFHRKFTSHDNKVRHWSATIAHIQLVFGVWLYFISPVIDYFLHNYKDAVKQPDVRFFGMEHSVMMLSAIVLITIGSAKTKRKEIDKDKFKTLVIWYAIALIIILVTIPWPFSLLSSRPYLR